MKNINAFIYYAQSEQASKTVAELKQSPLIASIYMVTTNKELQPLDGCELIYVEAFQSTETIKKIARFSTT
ncbi:MAG: glycosyltransferase family 2 protein, partial [Dysgonamonadaceae bacterium]